MLILGIDPGSVTSGWGLIKANGNKLSYVASGILKFNNKECFNYRLNDVKLQVTKLLKEIKADEVAMESLIYVKSPTALIKLAQARGVILSVLYDQYLGHIFEYSPNLVKSTAVGHGHADKISVQKFLDTLIGKREYQTYDESDALAVAICHYFNRNKALTSEKPAPRKNRKGLAGSLSHMID